MNIFGRSLQMIGLTGGIACGKTTVVNLVRENFKNIGIIDCDGIAKEVIRPGRRAYNQIVKEFGRKVVMINGNIDREELGNIIFYDRDARKKLDRIMMPVIFYEIIKQLLAYKFNGITLVLIDAPLLFESKILTYFCCPIITLHISDKNLWVKRLCERDLISINQAKQKIACQWQIETKIALSDIAIDNSGSVYQLENSVLTAFRNIS